MTTTRVAPPATPADATYTKSTHSTAAGNCVAVGYSDGWVRVQDTKQDPDDTRRTTVAVPTATFAAFLDAVRTGTLH
ncbi:MAG: DUF397 domain-containing protein [Pseudonocardiaceae bacterium]